MTKEIQSAELLDQWIAALRSGEYKQITGALKKPQGYCCLGVLCELMGEKFSTDDDGKSFFVLADGGLREKGELPHSPFAGMGKCGDIDGIGYAHVFEGHSSLAEANDDLVDFKEIADWLEANRSAVLCKAAS